MNSDFSVQLLIDANIQKLWICKQIKTLFICSLIWFEIFLWKWRQSDCGLWILLPYCRRTCYNQMNSLMLCHIKSVHVVSVSNCFTFAANISCNNFPQPRLLFDTMSSALFCKPSHIPRTSNSHSSTHFDFPIQDKTIQTNELNEWFLTAALHLHGAAKCTNSTDRFRFVYVFSSSQSFSALAIFHKKNFRATFELFSIFCIWFLSTHHFKKRNKLNQWRSKSCNYTYVCIFCRTV